jgi:DNA-binding NarL/FixJ family response regulator
MRPADDWCGRAWVAGPRPVRVEVRSPHTIVRAGIKALLAPHPAVAVLSEEQEERADAQPHTADSDGTGDKVDVVIYDVFGLHLDRGAGLERAVMSHPGRVLALSRVLQPGLTARALDLGAVASISIGAEAEEIVALIHAAAAGHLQDGSAADLTNQRDRQRHLGHDLNLTPREQQVLALIVSGATNNEIARELYVSINTLKTLIRSAYKKIGVTTRPQAVAWGIEHGYPAGPMSPVPALHGRFDCGGHPELLDANQATRQR